MNGNRSSWFGFESPPQRCLAVGIAGLISLSRRRGFRCAAIFPLLSGRLFVRHRVSARLPVAADAAPFGRR